MSKKRVIILGSTGSIGHQTLEVISTFPDRFEVTALTGYHNKNLLHQQIQNFRTIGYIGSKDILLWVVKNIPSDIVVVATVNGIGLDLAIEALKSGRRVAMADKEAVVLAGDLIMDVAKKHGSEIIPIDSEASAIHQCLQGYDSSRVRRIFLTCSGGPFRNYTQEQLSQVTPETALKHPNWHMGKKVTIDSASVVNKAFEVAEIHFLFGIPYEKIEVVIHPQSIVHSAVEFMDGSIIAQAAFPDMHLPIQYSLLYPERVDGFKISEIPFPLGLSFEKLQEGQFPAFDISLKALKEGKNRDLVEADRKAVELFLRGELKFNEIANFLKLKERTTIV